MLFDTLCTIRYGSDEVQILSWMAEVERDRIRKRQREGIDVALQNGVPFGRPKLLDLWKSLLVWRVCSFKVLIS